MNATNNLLIVAAAEFEAQPLSEFFKKCDLDCDFFAIGVGALEAANSNHQLEKRCYRKDVIFIGTCGTFSEFKEVELITTEKIIWSPTSDRFGDSYTIDKSAPDIFLATPSKLTNSLSKKIVACSPSISLRNDPVPGYPRDILVENVELYSVANTLKNHAKSLAVILAVTNSLGKSAHSEWQQNFNQASHCTRDFVARYFSDLKDDRRCRGTY